MYKVLCFINVYRLPVIPTKAASLISIPFPVSLFLFCLRFFWLEAVAKPAHNLVMLCKFKSLSLFISLEIHSLYGQKHRKMCICMTKCRAGFATGWRFAAKKYVNLKQGCQITAFLRPNLQQCSLFFFVLGFCFLCLLDYTNDDLASKMQWSGNPDLKVPTMKHSGLSLEIFVEWFKFYFLRTSYLLSTRDNHYTLKMHGHIFLYTFLYESRYQPTFPTVSNNKQATNCIAPWLLQIYWFKKDPCPGQDVK